MIEKITVTCGSKTEVLSWLDHLKQQTNYTSGTTKPQSLQVCHNTGTTKPQSLQVCLNTLQEQMKLLKNGGNMAIQNTPEKVRGSIGAWFNITINIQNIACRTKTPMYLVSLAALTLKACFILYPLQFQTFETFIEVQKFDSLDPNMIFLPLILRLTALCTFAFKISYTF